MPRRGLRPFPIAAGLGPLSQRPRSPHRRRRRALFAPLDKPTTPDVRTRRRNRRPAPWAAQALTGRSQLSWLVTSLTPRPLLRSTPQRPQNVTALAEYFP